MSYIVSVKYFDRQKIILNVKRSIVVLIISVCVFFTYNTINYVRFLVNIHSLRNIIKLDTSYKMNINQLFFLDGKKFMTIYDIKLKSNNLIITFDAINIKQNNTKDIVFSVKDNLNISYDDRLYKINLNNLNIIHSSNAKMKYFIIEDSISRKIENNDKITLMNVNINMIKSKYIRKLNTINLESDIVFKINHFDKNLNPFLIYFFNRMLTLGMNCDIDIKHNVITISNISIKSNIFKFDLHGKVNVISKQNVNANIKFTNLSWLNKLLLNIAFFNKFEDLYNKILNFDQRKSEIDIDLEYKDSVFLLH